MHQDAWSWCLLSVVVVDAGGSFPNMKYLCRGPFLLRYHGSSGYTPSVSKPSQRLQVFLSLVVVFPSIQDQMEQSLKMQALQVNELREKVRK